MSYDYNGCDFSATSSPHSALFADRFAPAAQTSLNVGASVKVSQSNSQEQFREINSSFSKGFRDAGVAPSKLTMGIPFYGKGYKGMSCNVAVPSSCLNVAFTSCPAGTHEAGVFEKTDIDARLAAGTLTRAFSNNNKTPYAVGMNSFETN